MISEWAESGTTLDLIFVERVIPVRTGVRYIIMDFSLTRYTILFMEIAQTHNKGFNIH